ncbi:MAG: EamA family transporter [Deltaproteobacteria bacterium]|nr:EamA family transporter [Deltaproteobacteria bacterium]
MKAQWPSNWREISAISIVGILIHILYLGCVFIALNHDIPAGVVTLIAALQPIFTAALSFSFLKEKVIISQWIGIIIGICGVALVIQDSIYLSADILGYIVAFMATLFLTLGVLFEKKFCKNYHLIAALTIQYITASLILLIITPIIEDMTIYGKPNLFYQLLG